jgi:hypothetical protein
MAGRHVSTTSIPTSWPQSIGKADRSKLEGNSGNRGNKPISQAG